MIMILKDLVSDDMDAIVTSETTTREEIQIIIDTVKSELEDEWQTEDIIERLPKDCKVYTTWGYLYY